MAKLETHVEHIREDVKSLIKKLDSHVAWEEQKYIEMDNKYAPKWVQSVVLVTIGTVAIFVLETMFSLFSRALGV